ncbi:MAG: hypothetical protein Q8Q09_06225 [Deltaproteobacteria bacterium]|nr:hypothetical protein [Deltaproteobacteria bacterium]
MVRHARMHLALALATLTLAQVHCNTQAPAEVRVTIASDFSPAGLVPSLDTLELRVTRERDGQPVGGFQSLLVDPASARISGSFVSLAQVTDIESVIVEVRAYSLSPQGQRLPITAVRGRVVLAPGTTRTLALTLHKPCYDGLVWCEGSTTCVADATCAPLTSTQPVIPTGADAGTDAMAQSGDVADSGTLQSTQDSSVSLTDSGAGQDVTIPDTSPLPCLLRRSLMVAASGPRSPIFVTGVGLAQDVSAEPGMRQYRVGFASEGSGTSLIQDQFVAVTASGLPTLRGGRRQIAGGSIWSSRAIGIMPDDSMLIFGSERMSWYRNELPSMQSPVPTTSFGLSGRAASIGYRGDAGYLACSTVDVDGRLNCGSFVRATGATRIDLAGVRGVGSLALGAQGESVYSLQHDRGSAWMCRVLPTVNCVAVAIPDGPIHGAPAAEFDIVTVGGVATLVSYFAYVSSRTGDITVGSVGVDGSFRRMTGAVHVDTAMGVYNSLALSVEPGGDFLVGQSGSSAQIVRMPTDGSPIVTASLGRLLRGRTITSSMYASTMRGTYNGRPIQEHAFVYARAHDEASENPLEAWITVVRSDDCR